MLTCVQGTFPTVTGVTLCGSANDWLRDSEKCSTWQECQQCMKNRSVYKHGNGVLVRSSKQHMMNVLLSVHTYVCIPSVGTHAGERSLLMSSCQLPHAINSVDTLCCQTHAATSACVSQIEQQKSPAPDVRMRGLVNTQQLMSRGDIH